MKTRYSSYACFIITLCLTPLFLKGQTAGTPDLNFGQAGQVQIEDPIKSYYGGPTVLLPDGKLIVAGYEFDQNGENGVAVFTRLLSDGSIDLSYGTNGQARPDFNTGFDGGLSKIALTADGKLMVVGIIVTDSIEAAFAARLDANGDLDPSFGQDGVAIFDIGDESDEFWCLMVKPDGKILLGGATYDQANPGFYDLLLIQILADGTPDPAFGTAGVATADYSPGLETILSLSMQADGKIVAFGSNAYNTYDVEIVRFLPNGTIDSSFATNGAFVFGLPLREDVVYAGTVQPDQKIVFCGTSFKNGSTIGEATLYRLNPDGSFDSTFGTNGKVFTDLGVLEFARALVLQPDGKILVGAESSESVSSFKGWLWVSRYNTDGSLDTSFGNNGKAQTPIYTDSPESAELLLQPDGKIVQSGTADGKLVMWRYLNDIMNGLDEGFSEDFQIQCAPNPVMEQTVLSWVSETPMEVHCDLFDNQGRLLLRLLPPTIFPAGENHQTFHLGAGMPAGSYFIAFRAGKNLRMIQLIKQ